VGGPQMLASGASQPSCQGQSRGRCRVSFRAEEAIRAGTAIRCVRMVAVVALAWNTDAIAPAARVRVKAMAARTSHAPLAQNEADGI
jgi:hypothetical protein